MKERSAQKNPRTSASTKVRSLLVEASIVPIPANQKARIRSVKSLGVLGSLASVSGWLRDCGFTESEIDIVVNKGKANARQESSRASGEKARRTLPEGC
jgi:hypothetical protein